MIRNGLWKGPYDHSNLSQYCPQATFADVFSPIHLTELLYAASETAGSCHKNAKH